MIAVTRVLNFTRQISTCYKRESSTGVNCSFSICTYFNETTKPTVVTKGTITQMDETKLPETPARK